MRLLRRLLGPANALILLYDHLTDESLEAEATEVKKYYKLTTVSELARALRAGHPEGLAAIAFRQPRRSIFLRALPFLRAEKIPATFYVIPDSVGTNRLSAEEELRIYFSSYPAAFAGQSLEEKLRHAWENPVDTETFLKECRTRVGPLPLESLDPTQYSSTWGRLLEIPPELKEVGLHLTSRWDPATTARDIAFVSQQIGKPVTSLYCPRGDLTGVVLEKGILGVVIEEKGKIEKGADPWRLPVWNTGET